jgi:hypothetical protein
MKKEIISFAKLLTLALLLSVGTVYAAGTWTPAPAVPPNANTEAPINVGAVAQSRSGALALGTANAPTAGSILDVVGNIIANGLSVTGASIFGGPADFNGILNANGPTNMNGVTVISGALKITAGSPGVGKVLTSDANGNVSWQVPNGAAGTTITGTGWTNALGTGANGLSAPNTSFCGSTGTATCVSGLPGIVPPMVFKCAVDSTPIATLNPVSGGTFYSYTCFE